MTVLAFLADYAQLFCHRAWKEYKMVVRVIYGEESGRAYVDISGDAGGIVIESEHPLAGHLDSHYFPEISKEQWGLFMKNAKPWRFKDGV